MVPFDTNIGDREESPLPGLCMYVDVKAIIVHSSWYNSRQQENLRIGTILKLHAGLVHKRGYVVCDRSYC